MFPNTPANPAGVVPSSFTYEHRRRVSASSAQVRAPRVAMAGRALAVECRPSWLVGRRQVGHQLVGRQQAGRGRGLLAPPARHDNLCRIRYCRIEQVDLESDDRAQAHVVHGAGETNGAVEAQVVGDGQRGIAQLMRSLGQLVDRRRTVEEREIGVAMKLGEGLGQPPILERMFYEYHRDSGSCQACRGYI